MLKYLIVFLAASLCSLALTPLVRSFARRVGAIDQPGARKIHSQPMPRLGGLSIFISYYLVLAVASRFDFFHFPADFFRTEHHAWIFLATGLVLGIGIVDDFRRLPPALKFFVQVIAGLVVALFCYRIEVVSLPFGTLRLGIGAIPLTVFWIVAVINAINLLDGLDGLASGTAFIVCITMFAISLVGQNIGVALVSFIFAGSILGFLRYNFHPASIFLGDSGSYFLGFNLALLSLQSSLKGTTTFAILIPVLALGLPMMDTALAMVRRLLKSLHIMAVDREKNMIKFFYLDGWSMFRADRGHIHHRLLDMGFTQKKAVILLYAVSAILGGLVLSSVYLRSFNHALLITAVGIAAYVGIRKLGYKEVQVLSNGALLPLFDTPVINRRILRVFVDLAIISFSYYVAFLLRFEGDFGQAKNYFVTTLPLVLMTKTVVFHLSGLYKGAWRYTNISDLMRMVRAVIFGCAASAFLLWLLPGFGITSRAVLLIDFNLLLLFVVAARGSFRVLDYLHSSRSNLGRKVLIYGVGKSGVNALREFIHNPTLGLSPVGFIDDDQRNKGKQVNGYPVIATLESLESILEKHSISEVVLAISEFPGERLERLSEICISHQIPLRRFQTRLEEIPT
jgi:UDP-GlcNAc:undecaprenyl-phosphate GlcNAc-1-phosphate transferase